MRKNRRHKKNKVVLNLIVFAMILSIGGASALIFEKQTISVEASQVNEKDRQYHVKLDKSSLYSSNVYLVNRGTGKVLFEKKSKEKIYPASMTKIMSILIGIEHLKDLDEIVSLPEEINELYRFNAAVAGFSAGDHVTVRELFYAAALPSGADACLGIAHRVSGNEEDFVKLMQAKAKEIGMKNTHFTGSIGFDDPNHYTTARDMALLLDYALDNPLFYEIITAKTYTTSPSSSHPEGITLKSTLFTLEFSTKLNEGSILGGKTGTTGEAGKCLASFAEINGEIFILITAGARNKDDLYTPYHIMDAVTVYNAIELKKNYK